MKRFKLTPPEPSEGEIQRAFIQRLMRRGWLVIRINGSGFKDGQGNFVRSYLIFGLTNERGQPACSGFPDLLALKSDESGGIRARLFEMKKQGGVASPAQQRFMDFAGMRGVCVEVIEGWREMEKIVEEMDKPECQGQEALFGDK